MCSYVWRCFRGATTGETAVQRVRPWVMPVEFYYLGGKSAPRYKLLQSWFRAGRGQKGQTLAR
eukprot:1375424-Lingulodinium_polyedra.AAC.1